MTSPLLRSQSASAKLPELTPVDENERKASMPRALLEAAYIDIGLAQLTRLKAFQGANATLEEIETTMIARRQKVFKRAP